MRCGSNSRREMGRISTTFAGATITDRATSARRCSDRRSRFPSKAAACWWARGSRSCSSSSTRDLAPARSSCSSSAETNRIECEGMTLPQGTRFGPYEVDALIGKGGMGEVYRARDSRLGRVVAIKVLSLEFTSDPDRVQRFEREARVLAAVNHPHIATIHGVEDAEGMSALVMELVDGETLADRIMRGALPVPAALALAGQIAD